MRTAHVRAGWFLTAATVLGMVGPAPAQRYQRYSYPYVARGMDAGASPDPTAPLRPISNAEARLAEMKVELAWLANQLTFPCLLAARVEDGWLVVGGEVPDPVVRQQAIFLAREQSGLPVKDRLTIQPGSPPPVPRQPDGALCRNAVAALSRSFAAYLPGLRIEAGNNGQITILGTIPTLEAKLAVSRRLSQLPGCTCIYNQLHVGKPASEAPQIAQVSAAPPAPVMQEGPAVSVATQAAVEPVPEAIPAAAVPVAPATPAMSGLALHVSTEMRAPVTTVSAQPIRTASNPTTPFPTRPQYQAAGSPVTAPSVAMKPAVSSPSLAARPTAPLAVASTVPAPVAQGTRASPYGWAASSVATASPGNSPSAARPGTSGAPASSLPARYPAASERPAFASASPVSQPANRAPAATSNKQPAALPQTVTSTAIPVKPSGPAPSATMPIPAGSATVLQRVSPYGWAARSVMAPPPAPVHPAAPAATPVVAMSASAPRLSNAPAASGSSGSAAKPSTPTAANGSNGHDRPMPAVAKVSPPNRAPIVQTSATVASGPSTTTAVVQASGSVTTAKPPPTPPKGKSESTTTTKRPPAKTTVAQAPAPPRVLALHGKESAPLKPAGPPPMSPTVQKLLAQRIERTCAGNARDVKIVPQSNTSLVVIMKVHDAPTGRRLGNQVLKLPELGPYQVKLEVQVVP